MLIVFERHGKARQAKDGPLRRPGHRSRVQHVYSNIQPAIDPAHQQIGLRTKLRKRQLHALRRTSLDGPPPPPEQVVDDTVISAFQSAGQRCSAQRLLFLDESAAPRMLEILAGALAELKVGDPRDPDTDIGPIIDAPAQAALARHVESLRRSAKLIGEAPPAAPSGHFISPIAFQLPIAQLPRAEVFGPVLHVCTYRRAELPAVLRWLRDTGYGLTLGIHSRIQSFVDTVVDATRVGNTYVNRSMIGAVVGVQPFGGEGLSGTGPKAGGPHYMLRFATERTVTVNTAAIGGVTELLSDQRAS